MEIVESQLDSPAIKTLGSLFKLTQVFLWDDDLMEKEEEESCVVSHRVILLGDVVDDNNAIIDSGTRVSSSSMENVELTMQLNALGLPLSFHTNKQKTKGVLKGKRKSTHGKHPFVQKNVEDELQEVSRVSEGDIVSSTTFHDNTSSSLCYMSMLGEKESSSCYDVAVDLDKSLRSFSEGEDSVGLTAKTTLGAVKEHIDDGLSDILSSNSFGCNFEHTDFVLKDDMKNVASPVNLDVETSPGNYLPHAGTDEDKSEPGGEVENGCSEGSEAKGDNNCNDFNIEFPYVPDVDASSQILEVHNRDDIDSYECYGYFGDWSAYWDSFYMRYYFYNIKTHESTWYPPPGREHLASGDIAIKSNGTVADVTSKDDSLAVSCYVEPTDLHGLHRTNSFEEATNEGKLSDQPLDELLVGIERADDNPVSSRTIHCVSSSFEHEGVPHDVSKGCKDEMPSCLLPDTQEIISSLTNTITKKVPEDNSVVAIKRKKKVRRVRSQRKLSIDLEELQLQDISEEFSVNLSKYWCQRYQLFSRFDDGIKMDEEGWYSVTPERLARHHASRCGSGIIVDCFTGVGGNAIQFAQRSKHVIAIDIDSERIGYAQHNAVIYEVEDRIDFMNGDFFLLAPNLKADTVFLSPPWGGPDYVKVETYDIKTMLEPQDGYFLFNVAKEVASRIVMFLPRNVDVNQIAELALSADPPWSVEVEKNFLNGKFKAITAYFSETRV